MKYKIYEGLSDYLMAPDGTVIHKETTAIVPFEKSPLGSMVKLITDETYTMLKGKRKAIRLVRRYTKEQIMKMYTNSKVEFKDDLPEVTEKIKAEKVKGYVAAGLVESECVGSAKCKASGDPEHVKNADQAMTDIVGFMKDTLSSFHTEASQISQEQMDQLAASKRTVKSNPKSKKAEVKKVQKVIKETVITGKLKNQPKPIKTPYLKIDGVDYQSANKASKALGISINTVLKRAKANKDGWFYISK